MRLKILNSRGEIATVLTVVTLGLMLVGTFVGTKLAQTQQTLRSLAVEPSNWDWDQATANGNCGNDDNCICRELGKLHNFQTGVCRPVGSRDELGRTCIRNKWDTTWGCWESTSSAPAATITSGPSPTPGGPTAPPTAAGTCQPDFVPGNADTGWCQSAGVRCLRKGGQVTQLPDPWCDQETGPASTCIGPNQKGQSTEQCRVGTSCGNKSCESPNENYETCPQDCDPNWKEGGPGETAGSPAPTAPPTAGGDTNGGSAISPGSGNIDVEDETVGGYIVIRGERITTTQQIGSPSLSNRYVSLEARNVNPTFFDVVSSSKFITITNEQQTLQGNYIYTLDNSNDVVLFINRASGNTIGEGDLVYYYDNFTLGTPQIVQPLGRSDNFGEIKICHPVNVTPAVGESFYTDTQAIIRKCGDKINVIDIGSDDPSEPNPEPQPTKLKFKIKADITPQNYYVRVYMPEFRNDQGIDILESPRTYVDLSGTWTNSNTKEYLSIPINPASQDRTFSILFYAELYNGPPGPTNDIAFCQYSSWPYTFNVLAGDSFTRNSSIGTFIIDVPNTSSCAIDLARSTTLIDELSGSSNEAFKKAMEKWLNGEIGALEMSGFINQLTRSPGLQISFCDPRKGECNPTF